MTELEREVKDLRDKYEEPIKKYCDASKVLNAAIWTTEDLKKKSELIKLDMKLFPIDAVIAAGCAISNMHIIDDGFNSYGVCEEKVIKYVTEWKAEMEKIEV